MTNRLTVTNTADTDQYAVKRKLETAKDLVQRLYAQGVLSLILRDEESKRMIVKLGLTFPIGQDEFMLFGRENQTVYIFACTRNPDRNNGRLQIIGYRFEIDVYQQNPIKNIPEVRDGFRCCMFAVAQVERIDMAQCIYNPERPALN